MPNNPQQPVTPKGPRPFFRLLALLLLGLALVETPPGARSALAEERTGAAELSREMRAGDPSKQAAIAAVTVVEGSVDKAPQLATDRRCGELDEPAAVAAGFGVVPAKRTAARDSLFQPDLAAVSACLRYARAPPPAT